LKSDRLVVTPTWRLLIDDGPADGAWNMALDRAVQFARQEGSALPTVRLYEWIRPTVSLGRFQDTGSIDVAFCSAGGIDMVRRHTGGRGVLHDDEVTYSVVAGVDDGIPRGTRASYELLCGGLAAAYHRLGVDACLTSRPRGSRDSAACYLHATHADLSLGVRKLSGSAQVWLQDTVLQHGSFILSRDITREASVFRLTAEERERLDHETVTLDSALGARPSRDEVRAAIAHGFAESLGVILEPGEPSAAEFEMATRLHHEMLVTPFEPRAVGGSR
jgi:lipoate-protein ligase A